MLDGGNRASRLAGEDDFIDLALCRQVNAHLRRLLPEPQRIGRRRADGGNAHIYDLAHARLSGLRAAGNHQGTDLLAGVVRAPEANEVTITEGEIDDIFGAHAKAPDAIAPHLADPVPVLRAVQHTNRCTPAGAEVR